MNENEKVLVCYHDPCMDGLGAAWAYDHHRMSMSDGRSKHDGNTHYLGVNYSDGEINPDLVLWADRIVIVDFSYPRDFLEFLCEQMQGKIVVLDHHKSAEAKLEGLDFAKFDMSHSGAVMAWHYFNPGIPIPEFLLYIEDRDLWNWKMPQSRAISKAMWWREPRSFITMDRWHQDWGTMRQDLAAWGEVAAEYEDRIIRELVSKAGTMVIDGHEVPYVNSPVFQSEIGEALSKDAPDAPFAAVVTVRLAALTGPVTVGFSLRSGEREDVSEVATRMGGGGHPNAAGFIAKGTIELEAGR